MLHIGDPEMALGGSSLILDIEEIGRLAEAFPLISALTQIQIQEEEKENVETMLSSLSQILSPSNSNQLCKLH